jgi:AcrR family transcriptional regulator
MPRSTEANQRLRDEQRVRILAAAGRVFAREGSAATMAALAAEAGVSQGLAYRYFPSKEAILRELLEQLVRSGVVGARVLEVPGTPGARIVALLSRMLWAQRDRLGFYQLLTHAIRDEKTPADLRAVIRDLHQRSLATLRHLIVEGQAAGEVAAGDPDQLMTVVEACLEGLTRLAATDPERFAHMVPTAEIVLRLFGPNLAQSAQPQEPSDAPP